MFNYIYACGRFLAILYQRFFADGCIYRSAALTYTTLLSLVPLMTVSFAIFAAFPVFSHVSQQIQNFIFSHFVATSGEVVQQYIQKFVSQARNLSILGSCVLVVTAVLMMFTMEGAFNAIWRVESHRKGIATFMLYWAVLTLFPILIGASIVVSTYITALPVISAATQSLGFIKILPFLLNLIFFTLIYVVVPNCRVSIRHAFIGALVATVFLTLAKLAFAYYVIHFPTYTLLYGALATIPLFLIWLYVAWMIILFGVVISHVLATGYGFRTSQKLDGFTHAYRWLGYFWQALQQGKQLSLTELLRLDACNYAVEPEQQLKLMKQAHLIQSTSAGRYVLSQDLSTLTLRDLLHKLPWRLPTAEEISQWSGSWEKGLQTVVIDRPEQELSMPLQSLYHDTRGEMSEK